MNKYLIALTTSTALTAFTAATSYAAGYGACTAGYGSDCPAPSINFSINKKVAKPGTTDQFVENLGINDSKFSVDNTVLFQLTFTNNSDSTISKVTLKDVLPSEVTYVSGGKYNASDKTATFEENEVKPGESRTTTLSAKVTSQNLPSDQSVVCPVNKAVAIVDGKETSDNAQFCIQKTVTKGGKQVFPAPKVESTPSTGPEALGLLALLPTGTLGYFLRKKAVRS